MIPASAAGRNGADHHLDIRAILTQRIGAQNGGNTYATGCLRHTAERVAAHAVFRGSDGLMRQMRIAVALQPFAGRIFVGDAPEEVKPAVRGANGNCLSVAGDQKIGWPRQQDECDAKRCRRKAKPAPGAAPDYNPQSAKRDEDERGNRPRGNDRHRTRQV